AYVRVSLPELRQRLRAVSEDVRRAGGGVPQVRHALAAAALGRGRAPVQGERLLHHGLPRRQLQEGRRRRQGRRHGRRDEVRLEARRQQAGAEERL
ncbi:MAG: hypothetical protein AVDCRST_MAG68-3232, partial [uncultured Gemmatimonadetes bacterium]